MSTAVIVDLQLYQTEEPKKAVPDHFQRRYAYCGALPESRYIASPVGEERVR
jgi:hypothetical protein